MNARPGPALRWLARRLTPVMLVLCPLLLFWQIGRWLAGYGWHFLTLGTVARWHESAAAGGPVWSQLPVIVLLALAPIAFHVFAWPWRHDGAPR